MALIVWGVGKTWGIPTKRGIITILAASAILPMMFIALFGMLKVQANPAAANEITSQTIDQIVSYFGNNIVYFVLSDIVGIIAGAIFQAFGGRNN